MQPVSTDNLLNFSLVKRVNIKYFLVGGGAGEGIKIKHISEVIDSADVAFYKECFLSLSSRNVFLKDLGGITLKCNHQERQRPYLPVSKGG